MHFSIMHNRCGAIEIGRHILLVNRSFIDGLMGNRNVAVIT